jgi:regulator of replication initiation timing
MTEGGNTLFTKLDLEEENRLLRVEVERLKQRLAAHGLPTASVLIHYPTTPLVVIQQPEDRQD